MPVVVDVVADVVAVVVVVEPKFVFLMR